MRGIHLVAILFLSGCVSEAAGTDASTNMDANTADTSMLTDAGKDTSLADTSTMDAALMDAETGSTKNFSCGTPTVCDFGTQSCCYTAGNNAGTCTNPPSDGGVVQCSTKSQYQFKCSATAQCGQGEVCCAAQSKLSVADSGPPPWNSSCAQTCTGVNFYLKVFCNNTSECVSGTCQAVGQGFPNGYKECK